MLKKQIELGSQGICVAFISYQPAFSRDFFLLHTPVLRSLAARAAQETNTPDFETMH